MEINCNHLGYVKNSGSSLAYPILKEVQCHIMDGKTNVIIGPSGSGKTTLLELCNGLMMPTTGSITIGPLVLEKKAKIGDLKEFRKKVGLLFQNAEEQFFSKTVYQEIAFGMKSFHYKEDKIEKRVSDVLKMVGLEEDLLGQNPFSLSSGEQKRVALASILVFNPDILLLDEPTLGLDFESKELLVRLFRTLKTRYHKTIFLATTDMEFAHQVADHIIVIKDGYSIMEGDKFEVFKETKLFESLSLELPKMIEFANLVQEKKGIKIGYRDQINDMIKDVYRYAK